MADARLRFLEATANIYATSVPATAAHLMLQRAKVADERGVAVDGNFRLDSCKACGAISPSLATENTSSIKEKTECLVCHRTSSNPIAKTVKLVHKNPRNSQAVRLEHKTLGDIEHAASHKSSSNFREHPSADASKQRTRAKKRGGLQAMVERSKKSQDASAVSGLDLMDFMKAG